MGIVRDQDCEGNPLSDGWTAAADVVTLQDASIAPAQGQYSVQLESTFSSSARLQRTSVWEEDDGAGNYANPDVWMSYREYIRAMSLSSGDNTVMFVSVSTSGEYIRLTYNPGLALGSRWRFRSTMGGGDVYYGLTSELELEDAQEQDRWARWKLHVRRDMTNGRIRVWRDSTLLGDISGVRTAQLPAGTTWVANPGYSPLVSSSTMVINIDDVRCRSSDPDQPRTVWQTVDQDLARRV